MKAAPASKQSNKLSHELYSLANLNIEDQDIWQSLEEQVCKQ